MNAYAVLGIALGTVAVLGGTYYLGDANGEARTEAKWQERESEELQKANSEILRLTNEVREQEANHAKRVNEISTTFQAQLRGVRTRMAADIAAVRAGTVRLRDHAAGERGCGPAAGATGAGPSGRDGGAGSELSGTNHGVLSIKATEFLLEIGNDADLIVKQLYACQQIIKSDRAEQQ